MRRRVIESNWFTIVCEKCSIEIKEDYSNFTTVEEFLEWIESTGWIGSDKATLKIPPYVIIRLYKELKDRL